VRRGIQRSASRNIPTSTARSVRSLAVDQEFGEGTALRVAPELSDPVGAVEVGEHEDVEQLGAGGGAERVEALPDSLFKFIWTHVLADYATLGPLPVDMPLWLLAHLACDVAWKIPYYAESVG